MNNPQGRIPDSFIEEVLARSDIVDVVGRYVQLKKGGANLLGLCPFHGEKTPSFTVSPSKQFYHCFGCGAHGTAIRFLMDHTGAGFVDTVRDLAQRAGLKMPEAELDPAEQARAAEMRAHRATLNDVLERAAAHYRNCLKDDARAVEYLKRRGLSGEIARDFGLGYAPPGWHSLASAFPDYDDALLSEAGLVIVQGEDEQERKRYDRFRDRIMFPIRSVKGEVIGFGGRVIDSGEPKYLNSPETPVFVKGRELYGLFEARTAVRERGHALVVEGYMDVVALAQSGWRNAVATLGTACTPEHVQKLLRFTDHVVFSFDGDAAGRRAAGRALEAALPHVSDLRSFRFLFLPAEHDPDSFIREHGAQAFEAMVSAALPLSKYLIERAAEDADLGTAEGRARLLAHARPLWTLLPRGALRTQILAELAETARMPLDELSRLWGLGTGSGTAPPAVARTPAPRRPRNVSVRAPQDNVARMLLVNSDLWHQLDSSEHEFLAGLRTWHGELFRWLERELTEHGHREWPELRSLLGGSDFAEPARQLVDGAELLLPADLVDLRVAVTQAQQTLENREAMKLLGRA